MLRFFLKVILSIITILLFFISQTNNIFSQEEDAEWYHYRAYPTLICLAEEGDFLWIGGILGLTKYNKTTTAIEIFNRYNSKLSWDYIWCIGVDTYGNKWIGNFGGGLVKYNNSSWNIYQSNVNLPDYDIRCIAFDKENEQWIGTYKNYNIGGLTIFNETGCNLFFNTKTGMPSDSINCIAVDSNNVKWVGTQNGLVRIENNIITDVYNSTDNKLFHNVLSIAIEKNGIMWIGTRSNGLIKFQDGEIKTIFDTSKFDWHSMRINKIAIDKNNCKWIGTEKGLVKISGEDDQFMVYNIIDKLGSSDVKDVLVDKNLNVWLITSYCLYKLKEDKIVYIDLRREHSIPSDNITCITIDKNNTKWISCYYGGLAKFDGSWTVYDTSNSKLPSNKLTSVTACGNGDVWVGTEGSGFAKFADNEWTLYNKNLYPDIPSDFIQCITEDKNGLKWIGTGKGTSINLINDSTACGLIVFDDKQGKVNVFDTLNSDLPHNFVTSILTDSGNVKWIGTLGGLAKLQNDTFLIYNSKNGLPCDSVLDLFIDVNNKLWIGTAGGFAWLENDSLKYLKIDIIPLWSPYRNWWFNIKKDLNNDVWFATGDGIVKYSQNAKSYYWYSMETSGIQSRLVSCIDIDANGDKWIGYPISGLNYFSEKIIAKYSKGNYCACDEFEVNYTVKETFNPDNVFTAQLSNLFYYDGYFYNNQEPVIIGRDSANVSGTIRVKLPKEILYKNNYHIRVSGSSPFARGVNEGVSLTIAPMPKPNIFGELSVLPGTIERYYPSEYSRNYWRVEKGEIIDSSIYFIEVKWHGSGNGKIVLKEINEYGCTDSLAKDITILSIKPNIIGKNKVCEQEKEIYTSNKISKAELLWSVTGNGNIIGASTSDTIEVQWVNVGTGSIKLTQTLNGYSEERTMNVDIQPKPEKPTIESAGSKLISSSLTGNQWFHNDTLISGATTQNYEPTILSGYYQVQVTGANGCQSEMSDKYDYDRNPRVSFQIGDGILKAKPGEEIDVPIYILSNDNIDTTKLESIEAQLKYNYTLLKPLGNEQNSINNAERIISLNMDYKKQELLKTLSFRAELGNSISTNLVLDSIRFTGAAISTTAGTYSGRFDLDGVCMEGGYPRLISNSGQAGLILISPNPSSEICELEYELIEKGSTKIYICNAYGINVKTIFESESVRTGKEKMIISTNDLPTGMYFVIMQTPTIRKAEILLIMRN